MTWTMENTLRSRVAIVGAGVAGLVCGRALGEVGARVTLFDKGRRPGGRVATRRADGFAFDHGAQYLTMESDASNTAVAAAVQDGTLAPWDAAIVSLTDGHAAASDNDRRRWVGVPGMSALPRHLSAGMDVFCGLTIASVTRAGDGWRLLAEDGSAVAEADLVVVAVPAPQAIPLLAESPGLASSATSATMAPCWAVMLGFETPLALPFDAAFVDDGPLAWVSRDRSKPGRDGGDAWVLHASVTWSHDYLEAGRREVLEHLCRAFRTAIGTKTPSPAFAAAHRWRYARVENPLGEACVFNPDLRIGACGDWCLGGKIEAAMESGLALADRIITWFGSMPANKQRQNRR